MTGAERRYSRIALMTAAALAMAAAMFELVEYFGNAFISGRPWSKESGNGAVAVLPLGQGAMSLHEDPHPLPELQFEDGNGRPVTLVTFRGKFVLLNLWATRCVTCRQDIMMLDRLQAKLGGPDLEVVALSTDRAGIAAVTKLYAELGVRRLAKYIDVDGKSARQLSVVGLPTTLLIDGESREVGRLVGPAEWNASEMLALIQNRTTYGRQRK